MRQGSETKHVKGPRRKVLYVMTKYSTAMLECGHTTWVGRVSFKKDNPWPKTAQCSKCGREGVTK